MKQEQLIELIQTVSSSRLTDFTYEENGIRIDMKKEQRIVSPEQIVSSDLKENLLISDAGQNECSKEDRADEKLVRSLLVGTFYAAPSEEAAPFVCAGDTVKKGQTLAIVEAMKLMNEIESEFDGVVEEILVKNGQAVEYGQPLFRLK